MYEQQYNPYGANMSIVKGYFKSGVTLTLGIIYLITAVVNIITAISGNSSLMFASLLQNSGLDSDILNTYSSLSVGITILSSCLTILTAVAFIIIFATSRSSSETTGPGAGISILHVLAVISFVCSIVLVSIIGVIYVFAMIGLSNVGLFSSSYYSSSYGSAISVGFIIATIILAALAFLYIFYTASCKNFYRSAKYSLRTPDLHTKGAGAYGVFNILFAVFYVIGLILYYVIYKVNPFASYSYSYYGGFRNSVDVMSIISTVLTLATFICTAALALGYKGYINRQKYSYNNTPYGGGINGGYGSGYQDYQQGGYQGYNNYQAPAEDPGYNYPKNNSAYNDNYSDSYNAKQNTSSYCPNCGAQTDASSPFCPNCGTKL